MPAHDESYLRANAEANEIFGRLVKGVDERVSQGDKQVSVLDVTRGVGLELDSRVLDDLHIPEYVPVQSFLPVYIWFPVYPLWCWWWRFNYPWYQCCPYWWHSCHWWVG